MRPANPGDLLPTVAAPTDTNTLAQGVEQALGSDGLEENPAALFQGCHDPGAGVHHLLGIGWVVGIDMAKGEAHIPWSPLSIGHTGYFSRFKSIGQGNPVLDLQPQ